MIRRAAVVVLVSGSLVCAQDATAPPASASIGSTVCGVAGVLSGLLGKACSAVGGPVGKLAGKIFGGGGSSAGSSAASLGARLAGFAAVGIWAFKGAKFTLTETSKMLGTTTNPQLGSTWFSGTYWRMTAISALLTLPFLFAAAVQALMRSDLAMLLRAAFGYLPLAALAIAIAAPLTALLLAGSDEMSSLVGSATGTASTHVLRGAGLIAGFAYVIHGSTFFVFVVSALTIAGALALWLELMVRDAAVYVIVLMLPLAFAAMVWPARRVWAIRAVELLVALILSKFAIVAVLTLGGGALNRIGHFGIGSAIAGIALLLLATFAPWALMRLLPVAELASGAVSGLRREVAGLPALQRFSASAAASDGSDYTDDGAGLAAVEPARIYDQAVDTPAPARRGPADDRAHPRDSGVTLVAAPVGAGGADADREDSAGASGPSGGGPGSPTNGSGGAVGIGDGIGGTEGSGGGTAGSGGGTAGPRIPGLGQIWRAADGEHRPLTLGAEDDRTPVWPQDTAGEEPRSGEDHDPLPERQPPDELE